jgi:hypothetical protein
MFRRKNREVLSEGSKEKGNSVEPRGRGLAEGQLDLSAKRALAHG